MTVRVAGSVDENSLPSFSSLYADDVRREGPSSPSQDFELVGDHHAGRRNGAFQEFCHEPLRHAGVSAALDQDVENEATLIDRAPQPVLFARD
jgi:hypothetical protein